MRKPINLQDVPIAKFWNDTHELTLIFTPKEVTEELEAPTGIQVSTLIPQGEIPQIPTNIKGRYED